MLKRKTIEDLEGSFEEKIKEIEEKNNKRFEKIEEDNKKLKDMFLSSLTDSHIFEIFNDCNYDMINFITSNHSSFDINKFYMEGTLLFNASKFGHEEVVRLLLSHAATDVNKWNNDIRQLTPLLIACEKGHEGVVRLLLSHASTDVNKTNNDEEQLTPLFVACWNGHEGVVRLLLSHAADLDKISEDNWGLDFTPLFIAIDSGHEKIVRLILNHSPTHVNKTCDGETPLYAGCRLATNEAVVRQLLNNDKINVNQANDDHSERTPTIGACEAASDSGNISNIKLLLSDSRTYRNRPIYEEYAQVYDEALRSVKSERNARFRGLIRAAVVFRRIRLRAAMTVYAPGGTGFKAVSANFNNAVYTHN